MFRKYEQVKIITCKPQQINDNYLVTWYQCVEVGIKASI